MAALLLRLSWFVVVFIPRYIYSVEVFYEVFSTVGLSLFVCQVKFWNGKPRKSGARTVYTIESVIYNQ